MQGAGADRALPGARGYCARACRGPRAGATGCRHARSANWRPAKPTGIERKRRASFAAWAGAWPHANAASGGDAGLSALSGRELEIADRVARGVRVFNREIAEQLFLSPKTVEAHLTVVFTKLGVASRSEAAEARCVRGRRHY